MNDTVDVNEAITNFPRRRARTLRFTCGAPRSAQVIADGTRALFLRSDGPEDLVTSLWMSETGTDADGNETHREVKLADPRDLLADADSEDVPAEEKARRERAREGGTGIVGYSVDAAGRRVVFTINGRLFLTEIADENGDTADGTAADGAPARTRQLAADRLDGDADRQGMYGPVLNPRISPDGRHVLYTTGEHLILIDIADWADAQADAQERADAPAGDLDDGVFIAMDDNEDALSEGVFDVLADDAMVDEAMADGRASDAGGDRIGAIWGVCDGGDGCGAGHGDDSGNTWKIGLAEFVAGEEMDRYDGFWWAPDSRHILFETFDSSPEPMWYISDPANPGRPAVGRRYPRALTANADTTLTVAALSFDDDGRYAGIDGAPVRWDRKTYEYIAAVHWSAGHQPIVLVQDRCQRNDQVLAVTPDGDRMGETRVLATHHNDQWIDLIHGTPAFTPDGRLVCSLNDMDSDTNRLTVDGRAFTPAGWNVRQVLDVTDKDVLAVVQREPDLAPDVPAAWTKAGSGAADERRCGGHDARSFDVVSIAFDGVIEPVTTVPGSWTASRGARGMVVSGRDMAHDHAMMWHNGHAIASDSAHPGFTPNVTFTRLGEHRLYTAIIAPSASSPYAHATSLPVLMKPYGGPGFQQVVASQSFYWEGQWWADQGFLVVTADGRGTTGRGPKWDREIFENMKDVTLADQVEAVRSLPDAVAALNAECDDPGKVSGQAADEEAGSVAGRMRIPEPDLDKVCMIGWSYGGFLSALAVLDAPDVFKAGCAGAPPTDWTLYDTHYTERYLGLDPKVYAYNGIVQDAPKLSRALMLIHGFADDNVTIAHSLRLSQALMAAGRPHTYLPLTGITHMTNDETVAENLLVLQRDFLREKLGL
ncbi:prolyl oligopeptidase family serine peptidase [Bifidobacterium aerophilum]|uniref:Prolyl oligopeptidase family serine peptidase n=1 Tax=Bifidobacterium aerophilum TaxID=1798155 RepID=A0A6N9Z4B6_9BIFI|nr:prolyl oligopeptidase family serine peptidase [Bifidobacterium aerophilum]NEG89438.1 prolyl oligopeptidase family serine peptidase [Bifidobacterium aerophilum]